MNILIGIVLIVSLVSLFFYTHVLALGSGVHTPIQICGDMCGCDSGCRTHFYTKEEFERMIRKNIK